MHADAGCRIRERLFGMVSVLTVLVCSDDDPFKLILGDGHRGVRLSLMKALVLTRRCDVRYGHR